MAQILVAIDTDSGLTGYGVGGGGLAGVLVARTVLRDVLLGQNPEPVEELCKRCTVRRFPSARRELPSWL